MTGFMSKPVNTERLRGALEELERASSSARNKLYSLSAELAGRLSRTSPKLISTGISACIEPYDSLGLGRAAANFLRPRSPLVPRSSASSPDDFSGGGIGK